MVNTDINALILRPPHAGMPAVDSEGRFTQEWINFFHQQTTSKVNYINANYINQVTTSPSTSGVTIAQQTGANSYGVSIGLSANLESISVLPNGIGSLVNDGSGTFSYTSVTGGTVTSVSVAAQNGFSGSVQTPTTTPQITLSTSISGILKGQSGSLVAAVAGTDYLTGISFTPGSIIYTGPTGTFAQDNANLYYNPSLYASMPGTQIGPRGTNPIDAAFEWYVASGVTAHFHNVNPTQSSTGGVTIALSYVPTGSSVTSGNRIGSFEFAGSTNASDNVGSGAAIRCYSKENFTSTTLGSKLVVQTCPVGSATLTTALTIDSDQTATFTTTVATGTYAVGSLPSGQTGMRAMVSNALAPTFGATVVAGGAVTVPVFYNGTTWCVG